MVKTTHEIRCTHSTFDQKKSKVLGSESDLQWVRSSNLVIEILK